MGHAKPTDLLRDAIDAARIALREMEADEVPPRMRRVAAYSGGSLPPPLARSLLDELDGNEYLREKALEALRGSDPSDSAPSRASRLFLEREGAWAVPVVAEALESGQRHGASVDESLMLERDSLQAEVAGAKERLRRERAAAAEAVKDLRAELEAARMPGRTERRADQRSVAELEATRAAQAETEAALRERLAELQADSAKWRETARQERSARAALAAEIAQGTAASSRLPASGAELARVLDELVSHAAARAGRSEPSSDSSGQPVESLSIDPFIRPDAAEAIDWLVGAAPVAVLVDGYNLGFLLSPDAATARTLALEVARRLAAAAPRTLITAVFDSTEENGAGAGSRSGNLEVLYSSGETADDAIVARSGDTAGVVVVSNDRELRQRAEAEGAVTVWSDALVEWSRRR